MNEQMICVSCQPTGTDTWSDVPPITPHDGPGSATVVLDGQETQVVFGWFGGAPLLLQVRGRVVRLGRIASITAAAHEKLADLRDGPVEMNARNGRWRWRLTATAPDP